VKVEAPSPGAAPNVTAAFDPLRRSAVVAPFGSTVTVSVSLLANTPSLASSCRT
jgi:hypothetical protein